MSRNPRNKNISQSVLYHFGEKRIGHDSANISSDIEVRREGVKHLGKKAALVGGAVLTAVGGYKLLEYSFDNSPTVKYQRELQEQQTDETGTAIPIEQLDSDLTKITVHVGGGEVNVLESRPIEAELGNATTGQELPNQE